ncbi:MAG: hypothetical protein N2F24_05240 [Deltaproteobacteria bacterium]
MVKPKKAPCMTNLTSLSPQIIQRMAECCRRGGSEHSNQPLFPSAPDTDSFNGFDPKANS